ncbi:tectonic-like complex member MKS1 [Choristoneura fumiferana]|uniref:tectonic-like complex member MKS1 n=1 Tax=Choristoneura fumiferana TaxID=7141 RepID=UPI003D154B80
MNDFDRSNKVAGVYWLKNPIDKVKIKVHLKPCAGIKMLPKFETYKDNSANKTTQQLENNKLKEHEFKWQEKAFCLHEIQRYSNIHNCISDTDMAYHDMMQESEYQPNKIFTYINEDCYLPLPLNKIKKTTSFDILKLNSCFEGMNLNERFFKEDTSSMRHLFRSEESVAMEEKWSAMHVLYDNSEYNEDAQLLLKQETVLLSLYHNVSQNYLIVSPDMNSLDLNPYHLEQDFEYAVDVTFDKGGGEELMVLLKKLSKKWDKKHKQLLKFVMPPLGRKYYFVTFEIVAAENFDLDNLYIEFNINVPAGFQCADALQGRTHISKSHAHDDGRRWSFGHVIDLHLEAPVNLEPPPLKLFFEVISTDWWDRHRTEGYGYLPLSLESGRYSRQLSCSRPEELDSVAAESRRFFVGGCHLIKDLEILAKPQLQDANFKFTNTGTLSLRWSTITQVPLPGFRAASPPGQGHATAVLRGAEAALRQYSRARARLAAATKGLDGV